MISEGKYSLASAVPKGRCFVLFERERDQPLSHLISPHLLLSFSCLPQRQLCSPAPYKNITTTTKKRNDGKSFLPGSRAKLPGWFRSRARLLQRLPNTI